ncbi:DUF6782 family putative metallopeptidase [Psychrobacillus sp. FSL K6-1267]|uniref:DUF6782 family putative metallopeptidase n=1 Tax=Psychrobacillus sp. FSL K6-1267 TaxID=2921543 RepID=UPI0030F5C0DF
MSLWEDILKLEKEQCLKIGKKFDEISWGNLNEQSQIDCINELADFLVDRMKIKKKPKIELGKLQNDYGAYLPESNKIYINKDTLAVGGTLTAVTLAHELRHAYQFQIIHEVESLKWTKLYKTNLRQRLDYFISNPNNDPVQLWKENYKKYYNDGPEYEEQPLEFDAFRYERKFLEKFFTE